MSDETELVSAPECSEAERFCYLTSLTLSSLQLDVYASPELEADPFLPTELLPSLERAWQAFLPIAQEEGIPQALGLSLDAARQTWEVDLNIVSNAAMQEINREYRDKDSATDVLSFALLADSAQAGAPSVWAALPSVQVGSLFLSLDWAREAVAASGEELLSYLSERFIHGMLHLMGVHHDTMAAYERVVAIQKRVLHAASHSRTED